MRSFWSPRLLIKSGITIAVAGAAPLLLYTAFGPAQNTALWPGILTVVAVPIGFLLFGIGLLNLWIARLQKQD